ncbi:hypothetical protein D9M70_482820 [compost metagenome]
MGPGQIGKRDVLADRRPEGDRGGVGAAAEFVDQHRAGFRIHHRQGADRVALHAILVGILRQNERAEHGGLVFARLVFEVLGLAAEVDVLDLRTGKVGLDQVVLGEKIGVLQAQALFHAARVGIGFDAEGHDAGGA